MQAGGRGAAKPPIGIAFEGDLGHRIDAVLAVGMLNGFSTKNESRTIALSISWPSVETARLADVLAGFYTPRPAGGSSMVGMPATGPASPDAPVLVATLAKKGPDGTEPYTSNINRLLDTADNSVLIRNMLLAQNDENATIVVAGPATGMARLLALYGARPQIATKCKQLVIAAGSFPAGPPDANIKADVAAARKLFAEWPTPIVAVGAEVGDALPYPGSSIATDFAWSPEHPIVEAYRVFKPMPYDAPAGALAATVYAVHPEDGYFTRSEPGTISVLDDGRTKFTPGADGKHRYLIVDPAQQERVIKLYTTMVSAQPAARGGRGGRGNNAAAAAQQQQQQVAPPKPADATPPKPADVKPPTP